MTQARFTELSIIYENKDISRDIAPFLLSFTYNDNASDKADDIALSLEDRSKNWLNGWFPEKGDKITATIIVHDKKVEVLPCGTFEVDSVDYSGPPSVINIKAVSTLISKPMRNEAHTKAWEKIHLSSIAGDIATRNGLKIFWDCVADPLFERRDQVEISDLEFLKNLAADSGINIKVTDSQLVCYEREEYEAKNAIDTIEATDKKLLRYSFSSKATGIYKSARLQYHDPVKNTTIDVTENYDGDKGESNRVLNINVKAESIDEAKKICRERLNAANSREITGSLSLVGDLRYIGGNNLEIEGFGAFDGKYLIESASHTLSNGYTTNIKLSLGKEEKKAKASKTKRKASKSTKKIAKTPAVAPASNVTNVYRGERIKIVS